MCQLDHGNSLRPKEKQEGNEPKPDGNAAIGGNRRDDVQIKNCDYKKKDEVPAPKNTFEVRRIGFRGHSFAELIGKARIASVPSVPDTTGSARLKPCTSRE